MLSADAKKEGILIIHKKPSIVVYFYFMLLMLQVCLILMKILNWCMIQICASSTQFNACQSIPPHESS